MFKKNYFNLQTKKIEKLLCFLTQLNFFKLEIKVAV